MPILRSDLDVVLTGNERDLLLPSGSYAGAGTTFADRIEGNQLDNVLLGWDGSDTILGDAGADSIAGGGGDDLVEGGSGDDRLAGDGGNDTLVGGAGNDELLGDQETTFSGIVTAHRSDPDVAAFLQTLGIVRLTAWVRFGADLPSDVVFGIDQEVVEGTDNPIHVAGADWMGLVGVTRDGLVTARVGTAADVAGIFSADEQWIVRDTGRHLTPGAWYQLTSVVDFAKLEFVSFSIEGDGIDATVDLSGLKLSLQEFGQAAQPDLYSFLWTASLGPESGGLPRVDFDAVSLGLDGEGRTDWVSQSGFEAGTAIHPAGTPDGSPSTDLAEGAWYLERPGALALVRPSSDAPDGDGFVSLFAATSDDPTGGDDLLDGGDGDDTLRGGGGDDWLIGATGNDLLDGSDGDDTLDGGDGNDVIDGGSGNDWLIGGAGEDYFVVDSTADTVQEAANGGADTVIASVSYKLPANVENLYFERPEGGTGTITGTGNQLDNVLVGTSGSERLIGGGGSDTLDGGGGADTLEGGVGSDTYIVREVGAKIIESGSDIDTVVSTVSFTLPSGVEALLLDEPGGAIDGVGTSAADTLIGNGSSNWLNGLGGNDWVEGKDGDDYLGGGAGSDCLVGGAGADIIEGGAGADFLTGNTGFGGLLDAATDWFVYRSTDFGDAIIGFDTRAPAMGGDLLDLSGLARVLNTPSLAIKPQSGMTEVTLAERGMDPVLQLFLIGDISAVALSDNILLR